MGWGGCPIAFFFTFGRNGFGSNFTGWVGKGVENLPREDF